ncbi:hypothetical protein [Sphingomonas sp. Y38-1Y]|uniref:hypothetical protein n=1 Tax=Sphingomonas sp. Y38-1Y TaxID=3078265 RepID=UPI0028EBF0F8|nr:hypothetical protein [Sphingomonas sp. Y38-1Y]
MSNYAADLEELAARLKAISLRAPRNLISPQDHIAPTAQSSEFQRAQQLIAERRKRDDVFSGYDVFGEPSWDILLDLFVMGEVGHKVSVSSAVIASCAPATTGLRHLSIMVEAGLIERVPDSLDKRRCFVRLTVTGMELVRRALS